MLSPQYLLQPSSACPILMCPVMPYQGWSRAGDHLAMVPLYLGAQLCTALALFQPYIRTGAYIAVAQVVHPHVQGHATPSLDGPVSVPHPCPICAP